ncbi:hypothetical protein FQA39_LY05188 [Lamprigera yunnana]|nr:hypothetical protein FQA39_LY05188 [Lamprigera yunnana]
MTSKSDFVLEKIMFDNLQPNQSELFQLAELAGLKISPQIIGFKNVDNDSSSSASNSGRMQLSLTNAALRNKFLIVTTSTLSHEALMKYKATSTFQVQSKEPLQNQKIKTQLKSKQGRAMFCLVREFLEYFNLDFTISVYEAETYLGSDYQCTDRSQIIDDLGISQLNENSTMPLLHQLIEIAQVQNRVMDINLNKIHNSNEEEKEAAINKTFDVSSATVSASEERSKGDTEEDSTSCGSEESAKDTPSVSDIEISPPILKEQKLQNKSDSDKLKLSSQKSDKFKTKSLSSLADLPPLQLSKSKNETVLLPSLYSKEFKVNQNLKDIDKMFDVDLESYEEDFMSDSEMTLNKTHIVESTANATQ